MSSYSEKLRHPLWQRKRLEVLNRDNFRCINCGEREKTLNVHHSYYVKGREVWDYPMFSLSTLCENCHSQIGQEERIDGSKMNEWEIAFDRICKGDLSVTADYVWDLSMELCMYSERNGIPMECLLSKLVVEISRDRTRK